MKWSLAKRLAKPSASIRSPIAIRSAQAIAMLQTWKPIRIGASGAGLGPRSPVPGRAAITSTCGAAGGCS